MEFFVRGDRFATYRYADGAVPGFTAFYTYGDRSLTQPASNGLALWLEHDNIIRQATPNNRQPTTINHENTKPRNHETSFPPPETLDLTFRRGTYSAGFEQVCLWRDAVGEKVLTETRTARVVPGPSEGAILDLRFVLEAPQETGITFGKTEQAFLCVRAAPSLFSTEAFTFGGGQMRNSLGSYGAADIHGRQANWCACVGVVEGETVGFALLEHPGNPFFPSPWRAQPDGLISPSPFGWRSLDLVAGAKLTLRYRLHVHVGYVNQGWADARLADFAHESGSL